MHARALSLVVEVEDGELRLSQRPRGRENSISRSFMGSKRIPQLSSKFRPFTS